MEPVDGFDTAEVVKLIDEGILLPFWVRVGENWVTQNLSSGVWLDQVR